MVTSAQNPAWCAVLPVRPFATAKSRLGVSYPEYRADFARAFARDTLAAVRSSPSIGAAVVVGADVPHVGAGPPVRVTRDPGGLNPAIAEGERLALDMGYRNIVVVAGDLPCLTEEAFTRILDDARAHSRAFVPDLSGEGTTILCASQTPLAPAFGHRSALAHRLSGANPLDSPQGARCDVDTAADLELAARMGTGPATADLLQTVPWR